MQNDMYEKILKQAVLVEDSSAKDREFSYKEFLTHLHSLIRKG
jgi:hypothetical protein